MTEKQFQQFYPTYSLKDKNAVLKEFEHSAAIVRSESSLLSSSTSILTIIIAILNSYLAINQPEIAKLSTGEKTISFLFILLVFLLLGKIMGEANKTIVFAMRKVVMLRSWLGIDYGSQNMVLPSWREEGAQTPFQIKLFNGYTTRLFLPMLLILVTIQFAGTILMQDLSINLNGFIIKKLGVIIPLRFSSLLGGLVITLPFTLFSLLFFRAIFFDFHENWGLLFTKFIGKILGCQIVENTEWVTYRAKLSVYEAERKGLAFSKAAIDCLLKIEDKNYFKHSGIDFKSISRVILVNLPLLGRRFSRKRNINPNTGGSTITQQLFRTLYLTSLRPKVSRKILEIIGAKFWLSKVLTKEELIKIYISSVWYGKHTPGILSAIKKFFPDSDIKSISLEQWFVLFERIAYTSNNIRKDRINALLNVLPQINKNIVQEIYEKLIDKKILFYN